MNKPTCDVFLSHNSDDKPAVEELARRLKKKGIRPWLDKWNLVPGKPWQKGILEALDECAACAIIIGPAGMGAWQVEEMQVAIDRRVKERGFRVIPVVLPGGERVQRSHSPNFLWQGSYVEFHALDDEEAFHALVSGIHGIEPGTGVEAGVEAAIDEGISPYRGLQVFQAEHAEFFFGREVLTDWLLHDLRPRPGSPRENRFLAVVGASGSGKSSLVRAGLIPALSRGELAGSAEWPTVICRPGPDPLQSLATALATDPVVGEATNDVGRLIEALGEDQRTLHLTTALALRARPETQRVLLLVDQFEEIFTMCRKEERRKALVDNLLYASTVVGGKTVVVLTLRVDFYGKCAAYPRLAAALSESEHQELVGAMNEDELRRAIERPALLARCEIEPGLTEMLLQDVKNQAGALPLLEYALMELWQRQDGRRLTISAYKEIGEIEGALEKQANKVFDELTLPEQEICKRIFLRLTQPGEETVDTKRRVMKKELEESDAVAPVLQRLIDARLITAEGKKHEKDKEREKDKPGDVFIEVSHEALIRDWSKLRKWIDADREAVRLEHRLSEAAKEWDQNGRDAAFLYRGPRLALAEEWRETHGGEPVALQLEFLEASVALRDREKREKERQRQHELEMTQKLAATERQRAEVQTEAARRLRRRARIIGAIGAVAIIAAAVAVGASIFAKQAEEKATAELAKRFWARGTTERDRKGDWLKASHYLMRAAEVDKVKTVSSDAYLAGALLVRPVKLTSIVEHQGNASGALFSADGARFLSWSDDGTARLWDSQTGNELATTMQHEKKRLQGAVFSQDESRILTWSRDGTARLWNSEGKLLAPLMQHDGLRGACFSPNERQVLTWGTDDTARIWDANSGQELTPPLTHEGSVLGALFSQTKPQVLTWSKDGTARLWNSDTGEVLATMRHDGPVWGATFSQDERWILTWSDDGTARLWDAHTAERLRLFAHDGPVWGGKFNQSNTKVLTWSDDGTARLWNSDTGESLPSMRHNRQVRKAVFSQDERWVLTWSDDHTARLWDAESGQQLNVFKHNGPVRGAVLSPNGQVVLTWSDGNGVRIWSTQDGQRLTPALRHRSPINQALFDSEGDHVLTAGEDGTVRVWAVENLNRAHAVMRHESPVLDAIYAPDSDRIMSFDGTTWVWDSEKGPPALTTREFDGAFNGARFSKDGNKLLTWHADGTARLWSTTTGKEVIPAMQQGKKVFGVLGAVFSPDERRILSWSDKGTARVWDSGNGKLVAGVSHEGSVRGAVFSADGRRIFSWGTEGTGLLWRDEVSAPPLRLEDAKWVSAAVFSDDERRVLLFGSDGTARFWDSTSGELDKPLAIHGARIDGAVLSREQRSVLTWSADATVRLWNIDNGKAIIPPLPQKKVQGAVFNSDETRILTWAADGTARVWSSVNGQPLTLPMKHAHVNGARFLPDGKWIMTWGADSTVRLWSLEVDESGFDKPVLHTKVRTGTKLSEEREELRIMERKEWLDAR